MKYHNHYIIKTKADLGNDNDRKNYVYRIYDSKHVLINEALTLSTAKEYIDSGYDNNYL